MKVVIQRVSNASVTIDQKVNGAIQNGLLILIGIKEDDSVEDMDYMIKKITNLRIFNDENGKMNLSLLDVSGDLLLISQFTLYANTKKGNRPSYINAAPPELAEKLYNEFIDKAKIQLPNTTIETGVFGADMKVSLLNDGPVTIALDSNNRG